jgi:hypothetical protein
MPKIIFEDAPLPPGTVFFENAVPEQIPGTISNAGPTPPGDPTQPSLDYRRQRASTPERVINEQVTKQQKHIADIAKALGGNFDPSGELDDKVLRFDIGRSDKFSERKLKFQTRYKDQFPNLQYLQVETEDGVIDVYRLDRNEPFKPVKNLRDVTYSDVAQAAAPFINEQTAAAVATVPITGGQSLTTRAAAMGVALYAGGRLQSGVEGVRGYEHTPEAEIQQRLLIDSGIGVLAETLMPGRGMLATLRDKVTKPMAGAERSALAAERQGLDPLAIGQVAESPVTRQAFFQAGGTSPVVERLTTAQRTSIHKKLDEIVQQKGFDGLSDANLQRLVQEQQNELDAILRKSNVSKSRTGQELQDAIQTWEKNNRAARDALYERATKFGQKVEFDIAPMKAKALEIEQGYLARPEADTATTGVQVNPPGKLLGPTLERLRNMHPVVTEYTENGVKYNALRQMIYLRDELHSIMRNSPNPAERKAASDLWSLSKTAMEDPLGGDRRFLSNYNRAKQAHIDREELLDKAYIKAGLEKAEPGQLTNMLLKPGNEQTIKHIREIAGPDTWGRVKEFKKNELISDPGSIQKLFDDFANDKPALDAFFSPDEQTLLKAFYGRWQQTQTPTVKKMIGDQKSLAERAIDLATKGQEGELRNVIELARNSGVDIENSMRAGIYQHVLNEASTVEAAAGGRLIDPKKLIYTVDQLRKKPALNQFMGADDWQRLEDLQIYSDVVSGGMDMGGSLQRGAIVGKISAIFHPWKQASAVRQITENEIIANVLADPVSYQKLVQARQASTQNGQIARLSQAIGLVAKRLSRPNTLGPAVAVGTQNYLEQE